MKKDILSNTLIAMAVVLLAGCTSNDPEKLIVGTWEGVSRVEKDNQTLIQTEFNYETQTVSYYLDEQLQESNEYPFKETLTLSEDGKLTEIITEEDEVWSIFEANYKLEKRGHELWLLCSNEAMTAELQIQSLTEHELVLVSTKLILDKADNSDYTLVTTHKR